MGKRAQQRRRAGPHLLYPGNFRSSIAKGGPGICEELALFAVHFSHALFRSELASGGAKPSRASNESPARSWYRMALGFSEESCVEHTSAHARGRRVAIRTAGACFVHRR